MNQTTARGTTKAQLMIVLLLASIFLAVANSSGASEGLEPTVGPSDPDHGRSTGAMLVGGQVFNVGFRDAPPVAVGDELHGARVVGVLDQIDFAAVVTDDPDDFTARASADPKVAVVERDSPDAVRALQVSPSDPLFSGQWGLRDPPGIDARGAWSVSLGDADVTVAVLDSGVDAHHLDLQGAVVGKADCTGLLVCVSGAAVDTCEHGTHVAGTVAARTDNSRGVAGVAQVGILDVKVIGLDPAGIIGCAGFTGGIASGIVWATDQGADIISMSIGGPSAAVVASAAGYAANQGVLLIAAAGNSGCFGGNTVDYPAAYPEVMAVANHQSDGSMSSSSSCGPQVEISAPGTSILSTCWGVALYCQKSGTSMATPHVSGTAALVLSDSPGMTATQVRDRLKNTADDWGHSADRQGDGFLNACKALGGTTACA